MCFKSDQLYIDIRKLRCHRNYVNLVKHDLESVKDSFHVTLVNDDGKAKAHKVILIALSFFFRNSESLKRIIITSKSSINRVNYPNAFNQYTVIVTQGYKGTKATLTDSFEWDIPEEWTPC